MRYNTVTICLACVVAVLIGVILYMYQRRDGGGNTENMNDTRPAPQPRLEPQGQMQNQGSSGGAGPCIVLFHATWCPHCKDVLPWWKQLEARAKGSIQVLDMESKDPAMAAHKLPGFPTIRFFPQGLGVPDNHTDYTGPRTLEGVVQYLSSL